MFWCDNYYGALLGPCKGGSGDSGFKFQTDPGFCIRMSKSRDSGFKFLIGQDSGFNFFHIPGIQISNHFSEIHFSNK